MLGWSGPVRRDFCGRISRGMGGGLREGGRAQLWSCFCPNGNTQPLLLCVNAGVLDCLFLWCFLLLTVQSSSHTGKNYVKGHNNPKMSSIATFSEEHRPKHVVTLQHACTVVHG